MLQKALRIGKGVKNTSNLRLNHAKEDRHTNRRLKKFKNESSLAMLEASKSD